MTIKKGLGKKKAIVAIARRLQQFDKRLPVMGISCVGKPACTVLSGNSFETAGNCRLKDYRWFAF
jgi:hypothetical protein